jgi:hypothetical protein
MSSNGRGRQNAGDLSPAELNRLTDKMHRRTLSSPGAARNGGKDRGGEPFDVREKVQPTTES